MKDDIHDDTAITFAEGFYQALGAGEPIEQAYKWARAQIALNSITESNIPIFIRKNG